MSELLPKVDGIAEAEIDRSAGPWREAWKGFKKSKVAVVGMVIVFFFIVVAIVGPFIAKEGINEQFMPDRLLPPSAEYWFGTDDFGRDILSRIIHGARISLWVGFFSVIGSVVVGSILGIIAGYYGRWVDTIISRIFDIMLAFPSHSTSNCNCIGTRSFFTKCANCNCDY